MNWEALGATADIIASFCVVISVVYLSIQIRNQTMETKLAMGIELANQLNGVYANLSSSAELSELFYQGVNDFQSLTSGQKIQLSTYFSQMLRIAEGMFYQHREGRIDDATWSGLDRAMLDMCRYPGMKSWWLSRKHWFSDEFGAHVSLYIASEDRPGSFWEN